MPNVTGVLLLVLVWALVELAVYFARRHGARARLTSSSPQPDEEAAPSVRPLRAGGWSAPTSGATPMRSRLLTLRPEGGARPSCVVLVHGLAGFDELSAFGRRAAYFRGVRERLLAGGVVCVAPRLPAVGSIEDRARALAAQLESLGDVDAYVIAHSMGGLDARAAIARYAPRNVRSLVTIATPHRGTPLAAIGARLLARSRMAHLGRALADLAPARVAELGLAMADAPGVRYASVLVSPRASSVHPLLVPTHRLLASQVGDNDGLVPVSSQAWGDVLAEIDTDHWGAVGWGSAFDAASFYASLVEMLPALGGSRAASRSQLCA